MRYEKLLGCRVRLVAPGRVKMIMLGAVKAAIALDVRILTVLAILTIFP